MRRNENRPLSQFIRGLPATGHLNPPLREVVRLGNVYPGLSNIESGQSIDSTNSGAGGPNESAKAVFVVENSGVFSALLDRFREYCEKEGRGESPNPPLICTHGQFELASLLLLDKLVAGGALLYYSGDFDQEGLLMMERLLLRYPRKVRPWHYTLADYQLAQSEQVISPQRLKQFDRVISPELVLKRRNSEKGSSGISRGDSW